MKPEQYDRLKLVAKKHFFLAFEQGTPFLFERPEVVQSALFRLWHTALHNIAVELGVCPCVTQEGACINHWSAEKLHTCFAGEHPLGFTTFCCVFNEGRLVALSALMKDHDTSTH